MLDRLKYNWTFQRIFYLLMGLAISISSAADKQWAGLLPGAYFLSMGIFAFGCASPGGCQVPGGRK
jgi:hypothetical protein